MYQSERAARKASILQMAAIYTVLSGSLLNVGVSLSVQGNELIANGTYIGAGKSISQVCISVSLNKLIIYCVHLHFQHCLSTRKSYGKQSYLIDFDSMRLKKLYLLLQFWFKFIFVSIVFTVTWETD